MKATNWDGYIFTKDIGQSFHACFPMFFSFFLTTFPQNQMLGPQSYKCVENVLCNYVLWRVYFSLILNLQLMKKIIEK
jgi:hypothetical protein